MSNYGSYMGKILKIDLTGMGLELEDLLRIGKTGLALERQLRERFAKP